MVLGYLVAGFVIGPHTPPYALVSDLPNIQVWAELGIIFVMFSLGLDFSFRKLMRVGRSASITALIQVAIMLVLGYFTGKLMGWPALDSFFLAGVLAISSTTIIFKAFDELGLRSRHFAEHVFAILIVEDLIAILLMVALSSVAVTQTLWDISLLISTLRLATVVGSWFLVGYFIIPAVFRRIGRFMDEETWTVLSTGLCLLMVVAATQLGYSPALGAFVLGSILAETREGPRIEKLILPLRDLFAAIFFVSVGMLVEVNTILANWKPVVVLTLVTVVGKIIGVTGGSLVSGLSVNSSVRAGFSLAQIGEFSFIIATLGLQLKATGPTLFPIAVAVSTITTFLTPYLIRLSGPLAEKIERALPQGIQNSLVDYRTRVSRSRPGSQPAVFARRLSRFALNAILVTVTMVLSARYAIPWLQDRAPSLPALVPLAWVTTIALTAPFIWGMFFAFRPTNEDLRGTPVSSVLAHAITIAWIGLLSATFFDSVLPFLFTLGGALLLFLVFYRRLGGAYRWFEGQLTENLKGATESHAQALVPWDLRLFKVHVHPNSEIAGKTLAQATLRQRFGLNVITIQRGGRSLAAPTAHQVLLPMDTLLVLGTEEGLEAFKKIAEAPEHEEEQEVLDYRLDRVFVGGDSPYKGKTIRDSGIRDNRGALIVGLENGSFRTTNPDPSRVLDVGDLLWVVKAD